MKLKAIVKFLNSELKIKQIKDSSRNGLQFDCGKKEIKKVGVAVDACLATFEKAKQQKVDLLIVHHGLLWKPLKYTEVLKKRMSFLRKNKISLYAVHLPLDLHPELGNNIGLFRLLGLKNKKKFGSYHGMDLGFSGNLSAKMPVHDFARMIDKKLETKSRVFDFGKREVKSVGIVSGGGSEAIEEAVRKKLDCFLVGEVNLSAHHRARDHGLNMIVAGHYATETLGVKAVGKLLQEKFKLDAVFIENKVEI